MTRVIDGDTQEYFVDLGFNAWTKVNFRLAHVDTPEISTKEGKAAKSLITDWLVNSGKLTMESLGMDKYGRWLAVVHAEKRQETLNEFILTNGIGKPYEGGKKT